MTFWFLALLGCAWIAVFLPAAVRARDTAPLSATQRFKRRMDLIAPSQIGGAGRYVVIPESTTELRSRRFRRTQQRRRRILVGLLTATAASFPVAILAGGRMWDLHLASLGSLVVYVVLLIGTKRQRVEAASKIRSIGGRQAAVEDVVFHEPLSASGGSSS